MDFLDDLLSNDFTPRSFLRNQIKFDRVRAKVAGLDQEDFLADMYDTDLNTLNPYATDEDWQHVSEFCDNPKCAVHGWDDDDSDHSAGSRTPDR